MLLQLSACRSICCMLCSKTCEIDCLMMNVNCMTHDAYMMLHDDVAACKLDQPQHLLMQRLRLDSQLLRHKVEHPCYASMLTAMRTLLILIELHRDITPALQACPFQAQLGFSSIFAMLSMLAQLAITQLPLVRTEK